MEPEERASEGGKEKEAGGNHTITTNNGKLKKKTEEEEERKSVGCRSNSGCIQFVRSLLSRIKKTPTATTHRFGHFKRVWIAWKLSVKKRQHSYCAAKYFTKFANEKQRKMNKNKNGSARRFEWFIFQWCWSAFAKNASASVLLCFWCARVRIR